MKHLALALSLLAAPVAADSICDIPPHRWEAELRDGLVGPWIVDNGPGIGKFGTIVRQLPQEPDQKADILPHNESVGMLLHSPEGPLMYDISFVPDERWNLSSATDSPFADLEQLNSADIGFLAGDGCNIDDLPRVLMEAEAMIDGTRLEATIHLFMVNEEILVGAGAWIMLPDGVHMEGRRPITMHRPSGTEAQQ